MYSLSETLLNLMPQRFLPLALALNDRAAVEAGLIESRVGGRNYVGLNGLVLTHAERDTLAVLTARFGDIYTKAMQVIATELSANELVKLGWPESLYYALRHEPPNRWLTAIGRFDFGLGTDGIWRLMEFNSDTPSGSQEVTLVEERLWKVLRRAAGVARLNPQIGEDMLAALWDEAFFAPVPPGYPEMQGPLRLPRVGFLVRGRHLTDMAQVLYYARGLGNMGLEWVVGDPNNLALLGNRVYLCGQPVDALYRLFPVEFLSHEPLFAAYLQGNLEGALKCLNNLRGFLAQSKSIMAWTWQERDNAALFNAEERETIYAHLPATYLLEEFPSGEDRRAYIIKEFYGREGAEVFDGRELDEAGWLECLKWRTFVAQGRIDITPVPHAWVTPELQIEKLEVYPCVGSFLIGGKWRGCYTRVGGRITTSQAQFIPTLVEA
jgi:glutathionylspermidine synthase